MSQRTKKLAITLVKWTIALGGMLWVFSQMSLWDRVFVLNPTTNLLEPARLARPATENDPEFHVLDSRTGQEMSEPAERVINPATPRDLTLLLDGQEIEGELIGVRLEGDINRDPTARELLVRVGDPPRALSGNRGVRRPHGRWRACGRCGLDGLSARGEAPRSPTRCCVRNRSDGFIGSPSASIRRP